MTVENKIKLEEIDIISSINDTVLRNLQITQCYSLLSQTLAIRLNEGANWCTFATWASKQAGQTIRREDMQRSIENLVKSEPEIETGLIKLADLYLKAGAELSQVAICKHILSAYINKVTDRSSDAVSRGNKKVFDEIAREFCRFINTCYSDTNYNKVNIDIFCSQLKPGTPPEGQEYLNKAFQAYYSALFETDRLKKLQLMFFANLCVGFHEQNRLQPEITEALNASLPDLHEIKSNFSEQIFQKHGFLQKLINFLSNLFNRTILSNKDEEALSLKIKILLHKVITNHLMTITLPPDIIFHLGKDLSMPYPENLKHLNNPELLKMLSLVDPTTDSVTQSGATDWSNLEERMHFIAELFRCFHENKNLFDNPFTTSQTEAILNGIIPTGKL